MKTFLYHITFISSLALWLVFPIFAAEHQELTPDKWPITVQDTVKDILSRMSEKDKELVQKTKSGDLIMFHHGWGTGIRNYYGLWRGNQKLITSACGISCHPDDASMIIIRAVWQELQNTKPLKSEYHKEKQVAPKTISKIKKNRRAVCNKDSNVTSLGAGGAQEALKKFSTGTDGCTQ